MRQTIDIKIKHETGKDEYGKGVLYTNELPRIILRGRDKANKRRQGKRDRVFTERKPKTEKKRARVEY